MFFDTTQLLAAPPWLLDVLDTSIRVTVLLGAAALTALLMRRTPAQGRHQVWTLALAGTLLLPVGAVVLPAWHLRVLPANEPVVAAVSAPLPRAATEAPPFLRRSPGRPISVEAEHAAPPMRLSPLAPLATLTASKATESSVLAPLVKARVLPVSLEAWLLGLWLTGIMAVLARVGFDWVQVWLMSRNARAIRDERANAFDVQQARLGLSRVELVELDEIELPITWGVLQPTVALPASSREWSSARLEAAMLHELAHVRRLDSLTQLMAWVACAIYWFHPLTWLAAKQMRVLREYAADDEVLSQGVRPSSYATELIGIVQALHHETRESSATLAMARRSPLGERLIALLDPHIPHARLGRRPAVLLRTGAVVLLVSAAIVRPAAAETPKALPRLAPVEAQRRLGPVAQAPTPSATPAPTPARGPAAVVTTTVSVPPTVAVTPTTPTTPMPRHVEGKEPYDDENVRYRGSWRRDVDELQRLEAMRKESGGDERALTRSLKSLARDGDWETETSRQAYLAATASVQDDSLRFEALKALLIGSPISVETGRAVLAQGRRFRQDSERGDLLAMMHRIRESDLVREQLADNYLDLANELTTQDALADALRELLHPSEVVGPAVERALTMAQTIADPKRRMAVMIEVTDHQRITPTVEAALTGLASGLEGRLLENAKERLNDAKHPTRRHRAGWLSWNKSDPSDAEEEAKEKALDQARVEMEESRREMQRDLQERAKDFSQKYKEKVRNLKIKLKRQFDSDIDVDIDIDTDVDLDLEGD